LRTFVRAGLVLGLLFPFRLPAAEPGAVVTLLEGEASVIRGTARYALAEGVRLAQGDVVELAEKGVAMVEFPDGTAMSLGPRSRVLALVLPKGKPGGDFYVAQGEFKHAAPKDAAAGYRYAGTLGSFAPVTGSAVMVFGAGEASAFVEAGELRVTEPVAKGQTATPLTLKTNDFYVRKAEQKSVTAARPSAAFIAALPRLFLDPLPSRMARYKDKEVQPRRLDEVTYAEVEYWLKGPPEIRRQFFTRFLPRAQDPAFRAALIANLKAHPEWDRTLFPEKYLPKPDTDAARTPEPRASPPR
jgi:hypothetical protein